MPDSFTKHTSQGYLSRLGSSIKNVIFGFIIVLIAFPFLFWNEGRAVKTYESLKEGSNNVISVESDHINPDNEGKLIHVSGLADTKEVLQDPEFPISATAIKLNRDVQMYQWKETEHSTTNKKLGGGTETETTYTYNKAWSDELIDSNQFEHPEGHENPSALIYENKKLIAKNVNLGAFQLSSNLINKITKSQPLELQNFDSSKLEESIRLRTKVQGNSLYIKKNNNNVETPQIGDLKINFTIVKPQKISIVSTQNQNTFKAYKAKNGRSVELLQSGEVKAADMFQKAIENNTMMTWILRFIGFLMIFIGIGLILKPLSVLADIVPFIGNIINFGNNIVAGILALAGSLVTIGIAWLFYRPLLAISLLIIFAGLIAFLIIKLKKPQNIN